MKKSIVTAHSAAVVILAIVMICICSPGSVQVHAAAVETVSGISDIVPETSGLKLSNDNYTAEWTGVEGKEKIGSDGEKLLCIPIKNPESAWFAEDFLDIKFTNAASINGKKLDAKIHIDRIDVEKR